jgi:hypothetical protein
MIHSRSYLLLFLFFVVAVGTAIILAFLHTFGTTNYADMKTALTTTTATFATLLGIITAGLMFTQGKFSELSSELSEKAPEYLAEAFSLEKIQLIENNLLTLRKTFSRLASVTAIAEEKNLYKKIVEGASGMYVNFAILSNLKLKQQGFPDTRLLTSEMDQNLYRIYRKGIGGVKKEWQLFTIMQEIMDEWEGSTAFLTESQQKKKSSLHADLKSSVSIWKIKEKMDKSLANTRIGVSKTLDDLESGIGEISKKFHEDRIPQLLSQMEHSGTIRGKYFYLAITFITSPLLINLAILPQMNEASANFFRPFISVTSSLSVMGVMFLLLYIRKILNV